MHRDKFVFAVVLSVAMHALGVFMAARYAPERTTQSEALAPEELVIRLEVVQMPPKISADVSPPERTDQTHSPAPTPASAAASATAPPRSRETVVAPPVTAPAQAFMDAPPAPTAQEWAAAGRYTLKNSKRYRHTWGLQVRSMMGTVVQGADQGMVRFRVEIHPDGTRARLDTLWSTSAVAEQLARQAVENMPPLPPTPTGKPLVFETTVSFQPFDAGGPPIYKHDCLPDPPAYGNPFAWDGQSPLMRVAQPSPEKPDPQSLADCLKQLPEDGIEAQSAHDQRQLEQWGSGKLNR